MKSIDLATEQPDLSEIIQLAEKEPVLLLARNGHRFVVSEADNLDAEVDALRNSRRLQQFLDERMSNQCRTPIEEIEKEIYEELAEP